MFPFKLSRNLIFTLLLTITFASTAFSGWTLLSDRAEVDDNIVFFSEDTGYAGRVRTTDGGDSWDKDWSTFAGFGGGEVVMVSSKCGWERWFNMYRCRLARTTDGGSTWVEVYDSDTDSPYFITPYQLVDINTACLKGERSDTTFFALTKDGGSSWEIIYADTSENYIQPYFIDSTYGYAWLYKETGLIIFFRTTDGGATWDSVSTIAELDIKNIYCKNFNEVWLCAGKYDASPGDCRTVGSRFLLHSSDSGESFDTLLYDDEEGAFHAIDFRGEFGVVADYNSNVFFTTDGGETWRESAFDYPEWVSIVAFTFRTESEIWASGLNKIYKSTDRGATWEITNTDRETYYDVVSCNKYEEVGVSSSRGIATLKFSFDGGETWTRSRYPRLEDSEIDRVYDIELQDSLTWYLLAYYADCRGVFKSTDAGSTWEEILHETPSPTTTMFDIEVTGQKVWVAQPYGSYEGRIHYTANGGETWDTLSEFEDPKKIFSSGSQHLWIQSGESDVFWHTTDGGESWETQAVGGDTLVSSFVVPDVFYIDSLHGWCLTTSGEIFKTNNGGDDWSLISTIPSLSTPDPLDPGYGAGSIEFISSTKGFIAKLGIFKTTDGGTTWTEDSLFSEYQFWDMDFADSTLGFAVGEKSVIAKYTPSGWISDRNGTNNSFRLLCSPNPFTNTLNIGLQAKSSQSIRIYDLQGNKITELSPSKSTWRPSEDVNSGVYIIKATVDNRVYSEKVLYLK